jgi:hypothetical protein
LAAGRELVKHGGLTVGAQTSRFSSVSMEVLNSLLWMRFSVLNPSNPAWAYFGSLSMPRSTWEHTVGGKVTDVSFPSRGRTKTFSIPVSNTYLVVRKGLRLEGGHVDLFVALALLAEGAVWQLAPFVGHEVAALGEGQIL